MKLPLKVNGVCIEDADGVIIAGMFGNAQGWQVGEEIVRIVNTQPLLLGALDGVMSGLEAWMEIADEEDARASDREAMDTAYEAIAQAAGVVLENYALIDNVSGFVWWTGAATTPEEACEIATRETGGEERRYEAASDLASNETGYIVYIAPDGFTPGNGQDDEAIAFVSGFECVGKYKEIDHG